MFFGGEARAAGGAFAGALVEDTTAGFGDAIGELAPDLGGEGEHAADDLAEGGAVVGGDPAGERELVVGEERAGIHDGLDGADLNAFGEGFVVETHNDAHEHLAGEGDKDACADGGLGAVDCVGEEAVERNGEGDVAEEGHGFKVNSWRVVYPAGRGYS